MQTSENERKRKRGVGRNPGLILAALAAAVLGSAGKAGARATAVAADTDAYMMSDFEGDEPLRTPLQGYWYFGDDRYTGTSNDMIPGNSAITSFDYLGNPLRDSSGGYDTASFPLGRGGEPGSRSLRFAYALGTRRLSCGGSCTYDPFVDAGLVFANAPDTLDLTGATAISFWARSDSDTVYAQVAWGTRDSLADAPDYARIFAIGPEWRKYSLRPEPSEDFKQPERGARKPFMPSQSYGLIFGVNRGLNSAAPVNALRIDDVAIEGWAYPEPVPDGIRRRDSGNPARKRGRFRMRGAQVRFDPPGGSDVPSSDALGRAIPYR